MSHIVKKLAELSKDHRPIPFWSWNDKLEHNELKRQIQWMHDQGIGGFFMHARGGLKTPYLSKEWMEAATVCCEEAGRLGMNAWLYDENGWPSGFAGGKLLEEETNRDMYIVHSVGDFDPSADVSYLLCDDTLLRVHEPQETGSYLNLFLRRSASTADILNPEVVQKFLAFTHEKYKEHFGEALSQKVAGFFTDEPQYYRAATPYTPVVAEYFREHYDTDILDQLGLLFVEKKGFRTFRYRYWLAMQTLMLNSFSRQVYNWCCENGLLFTGHYVEEPSLGGQMMCCGGAMPFYEYEHIPGIDWLGSNTDNEISPRQLGSAARQLGKKQTLTETFGCCGWNVTPADLKRIAGFQYACGANLMCHHLLPYSEHGQRKKDYPAHFNSINPWIGSHFKAFNDFFSGLGYLLSESEEPVNVAMLHPMRSAYFHYKRGTDANDIPLSELDPSLRTACRYLSSRGIAYHFLDETLLEKYGFVEDSIIGCGLCKYTYLVIPRILTMGSHTENLLRQFAQSGGRVLLLDEAPSYLEGEPFSYDYLKSNCSLAEIAAAQPFAVQDPDTELYCTYRILDGKPFLYVQNASPVKGYTQTFRFKDGTQSFEAMDPVTGETKPLPLTLRLEKNEGLLLIPSNAPAAPVPELPAVTVCFDNASVEFDTNYLPLDAVSYSTDGITYSSAILCSDLFKKLLVERYEGRVWLRYWFEVAELPSHICLLREQQEGNIHLLNGVTISFDRSVEDEPCVQIADITPLLKIGLNCYNTVLDWHQSEETYYALFGEGVTESLRNCIAYDTEIEPVYLAGHFGVYAHAAFASHDAEHLLGQDFYIGSVPAQVTELVTGGFPFIRGQITLSQQIYLETPNAYLILPGDYLTAKVYLNDAFVGEICFQDRLDISAFAHAGKNNIRVVFTIGNRNLLGPLHCADKEVFVCPDYFDRNDFPSADGSPSLCKLRRFYAEK